MSDCYEQEFIPLCKHLQGTHETLVSKNGVYSRLVGRQMKKMKPTRIEELMKENASDKESSSQVSEKSSDEDVTW